MRKGRYNKPKACNTVKPELVHKQVTPVPPKTLYQEAISSGEFVGTFPEFLEYMKGPQGEPGIGAGPEDASNYF